MGTDIHAVVQAKKNGKWVDVPSNWEQSRHYFLFAWLADVRNGRGFAGVPTHTAITPIAEPRGLPEDFAVVEDDHATTLDAICEWRKKYMDEGEKSHPHVWMGNHSHSWLTADEILAAPQPDGVLRTGIVDRDFYDKWDGKSEPESWCGGISGSSVVVAESPSEVTPKTTHVRIEWIMPGGELNYFIEEVRRLKALHGEVRLVFGFDS